MNMIEMTDKRFGRLVVKYRVENNEHNKIRWFCICDCGNTKIALGDKLRNGETRSCGCKRKEITSQLSRKHNLSNTRLFRIWTDIRRRCNDSNRHQYKDYGGRGITICEEWSNEDEGFINFYNWATENGYLDELSIDRKDVNGDYEPNNCRWTTNEVQSLNKRNSIMLTVNGQTKHIKEWAKITGISYYTLKGRVYSGVAEKYILDPDTSINMHKFKNKKE